MRYGVKTEDVVWWIGVTVCLLAAPRVHRSNC